MKQLELFHNSRDKEGLLKSGQFRKPIFNYINYMNYLMDTIHIDSNNKVCIPNGYIEQQIQPPYMGVGIYCFDNYEYALAYNVAGEVVQVLYKEPFNHLDLENPTDQLKIINALDQGEEKIKMLFKEENDQAAALLLLELAKTAFMTNFEKSEPIIGIMLFILYEHVKITKHDIVSKNVWNMIKSRYETYYILQNYSRKKVILKNI